VKAVEHQVVPDAGREKREEGQADGQARDADDVCVIWGKWTQ